MPVKQDGTLYAKDLKARQVPDKDHVDAPGTLARFIGTGELAGYDTRCRILEVVDKAGQQVNDAVDTEVEVIIQPQTLGGGIEAVRVDEGPQLRVGYGEGYFTDIVGVVPPGLPTSEHTPGHRGLEHQTQEYLRDIPAAHQPFQPGQPALAALAGAGQHGDPLSDEEKALRAKEAEWQRVFAEALSRAPEDIEGARRAATDATGIDIRRPAVVEGPPVQVEPTPAQPPTQQELEAAHARIFQAELEATPDDPDRALKAANEATGLQVKLADVQREPQRQDV